MERIPRQGFVLVDPTTREGQRLRECWTDPQKRPNRRIVPYTYVQACKLAHKILKPVFVEKNGSSINMYIHPSVEDTVRAALAMNIYHSGGEVVAAEKSARVIVAIRDTQPFIKLVELYRDRSDVYVESTAWVMKCVEKDELVFTPMMYRNPGGRRAGSVRTDFTDDDEAKLAQWIALKLPYKETGGRTGNRLYQQLYDMAPDPDYAWVDRHTWQSWRERYKKNAARLDRLVAIVVTERNIPLGVKGQLAYVREPGPKPKRVRLRRSQTADESQVEGADASSSKPGSHAQPQALVIVLEQGPPEWPQQRVFGHPLVPLHAQGDGNIDSGVREGVAEEDPGSTVRVADEARPASRKRKRKVSES